MRPCIPLASLVVSVASMVSLAACDEGGGQHCAALGDEVLPDLPLFSPEIPVDCGSGGWTDSVVRLDDSQTEELARDPSAAMPLLVASGDGLVAFMGDQMLGLDGEGQQLWASSYDANAGLGHAFIAVGDEGQIYVSDRFGSDAKIVVFDASSGQQITQHIIQFPTGGPRPAITMRDGQLWLVWVGLDESEEEEVVSFARLGEDGQLADHVAIPGGWERLPMVIRGLDGGPMFAAGNYSVFAVDPDTGEMIWEVQDGELEGIWSRSMVIMDDQVVVAHPTYLDGLKWRVAGYELETGEANFLTSLDAGNDAHDLAALDGDHVMFVGSETPPDEPGKTQPMIVVLDRQGALVAGERLAVPGSAASVELVAGGAIFVGGLTPIGENWEPEFTRSTWLRRYDPPLW